MAREIGAPRRGASSGGPPAPEEVPGIVLKFALIELPGVLALAGFFAAFFVYDVFPGRPPLLLAAAVAAFFGWALFSMWASGFFRLIIKRSTDAH